jgi:hypothetical protein
VGLLTGLDAERQPVFDRLWHEARAGDEQRLCRLGADAEQSVSPPCIDWAGVRHRGYHACSSREML